MGASSHRISVLGGSSRELLLSLPLFPCLGTHPGKSLGRRPEKVGLCRPGRRPSAETESGRNFILDFQPPQQHLGKPSEIANRGPQIVVLVFTSLGYGQGWIMFAECCLPLSSVS